MSGPDDTSNKKNDDLMPDDRKLDDKKSDDIKPDRKLSKKDRKTLLTGITEIGILIAVCSMIVHFLTRSQTLSEYASENPSAAYGTESSVSIKDTQSDGSSTSPGDAHDKTFSSSEAVSSSKEQSPLSSSEISTADNQGGTDMNSASENETTTISYDKSSETYKPGFTSSPISDTVKARITGISYPDLSSASLTVDKNKVPSYDDLRYLTLKYKNGDGKDCSGEMICNKAIASDLLEIFSELYDNGYRIDKIRLIDDYGGSDDASMADDNSSCFNFRTVPGKTTLSNHSLGLAVDINPLYNPYITYKKDGSVNVSPASGAAYADRSGTYPYKITTDDLAYKLFIKHGFTWGGSWTSCKDYQHFEKEL